MDKNTLASLSFRVCRWQHRGSALTLVELLVVIAILAIVSALLFPTVGGILEKSRQAKCVANLRQIGGAAYQFATEDDGRIPGYNKKAGGDPNSASWQPVIGTLLGDRDVIQQHGETALPGQVYCPSMKPWRGGGGKRYPRAYVANDHAVRDTQPGANTNGISFLGFSDYHSGALLSTFSRPAQTVYIWESEMDSDFDHPRSAFGTITLADGTTGPSWASADSVGGRYAFRHKGQMNVLFLDGHVESRTLAQAQELNAPKFFYPDWKQ